ncbi:MAG: MMPL family transporter [Gammaproteobacteria bacterium]|nr:MAG: MMPL family transporter [Gammaproteobacteria bacterium]
MIDRLENIVFRRRSLVIALFVIITVAMAWFASGLRIEASFSKLLPLEHEYMRTFTEYRNEFGGADRVLVALMVKDGDIFTGDFFSRLEAITDEVFFIPGVDRTQVYSLFTPNVRYTEVVEDGIAAGNVIPSDFTPSVEGLYTVRSNILKAGIVGRLVANDFSGAIVSARLLEFDPRTGEQIDYIDVARQLENKIRRQFADDPRYDVHIIGFAKVMGDIAEGAGRVVMFFGIALLITALLVFAYSQSVMFTIIALACSLVAVVWQLGIITLLGFGIDPMSILVPFLIFAIGISHAVQMLSAVRAEIFFGHGSEAAARRAFRRLLAPGGIALASDTVGFLAIMLIDIQMIREVAIMASLGVAVIILTNLILLPVLLSHIGSVKTYRGRIDRRAEQLHAMWRSVAVVARPRPALGMLTIALGLLAIGLWKGTDVTIGDLYAGVPELRADSRYNIDSRVIATKFDIGVDALTVIGETVPQGCVDYRVMTEIDNFQWYMRNVPGVQSVTGLPDLAKLIHAGWNEGSMKWRVLPRNRDMLAQSVAPVASNTGLLNSDCSVMPVTLFTSDHKATTIARIVEEVEAFEKRSKSRNLSFRLGTGNVAVMAATNEVVSAAQFPILGYVFAAVVALCLLSFRSVTATLCIVTPLALVSLLTYALMAVLGIGLKVSTLPVVALGVGIGVDYGIYIYSRLRSILITGEPLAKAYEHTLRITGSGVVFTAITLAVGVATWIFAPLKFQADMGILLTFMILLNMLGAIFLLPALACWLSRAGSARSRSTD